MPEEKKTPPSIRLQVRVEKLIRETRSTDLGPKQIIQMLRRLGHPDIKDDAEITFGDRVIDRKNPITITWTTEHTERSS